MHFLDGASTGYSFVFGSGGGMTLSNTGEVSVDYGGGVGGGPTGILTNRCGACPTDAELQFRKGVRNVFHVIGTMLSGTPD
jgi:hypothetical protein